MGKTKKIFKKARPWQVVALTALVAAITIGAYVFPRLSEQGGAQQPPPAGGPDAMTDALEPVAREIPVNGRLVYAQRAELTFGTSGEVGEILVQEGERVKEGQPLARLDSLTIAALEEDRAQAKFDLEPAQDELSRARKAEFTGAPLEHAQFEEAVAKARKALTDAQERLRDFQRDQQRELAAARKAKADAELNLDIAQRALNHYNRDQERELAEARQLVADLELALKRAQDRLANFQNDFGEVIANARLTKARAEAALEKAEDELTAFLRNPATDVREGEIIDVEILKRLEAAEAEARTNLKKAENDLKTLEETRLLQLEERQAAVPRAETALVKARDDLRKLEEETEQQLELRARQAAVEDAQVALAQAEINLAEELEGPDRAARAVQEKEVALAQEHLDDLVNPDPSDVDLQKARVTHARARLDDVLEDLRGGVVLAPFDGVVALLNVEVDEIVNDESRVIEVVAPGSIEVEGLIDETHRQSVKEGTRAKVTINSAPGQEFEGRVSWVSEEPRTERGVVRFPVKIQVNVPPGFEVPVALSQLTSVVLPNSATQTP
jgi:multidrug efflux pump subunit AcrA (membrane-fusion protein)